MNFICPACASHSFGKYCAYCGGSMKLMASQISTLLVHEFIATGCHHLPIDVSDASSHVTPDNPLDPSAFPEDIVEGIKHAVKNSDLQVKFLGERTLYARYDVLMVADADSESLDALLSLVAAVLSEITTRKKLIKKKNKVQHFRIICYLVIQGSDMRENIRACRSRFPKPLFLQHRVEFIGIAPTAADFHCRSVFQIDPDKREIIKSLLAQLYLEKTLGNFNPHKGFWRALFQEAVVKPTEALRRLSWLVLRLYMRPMASANEVYRGRITLGTAVSYLALLSVAYALISQIQGEPLDFDLPFGEILYFLLILFASIALAVIYHIALKLFGAKGTLKSTVIISLLITVMYYPLVTFTDVINWGLDGWEGKKSILEQLTFIKVGLLFGYSGTMYSVVHKVSFWRGYFAMLLIFAGMVFLFAQVATIK